MNVLELVQSACYAAGVTAPSSLISQTDAQVLQYINQFYAEVRSLRVKRWWPQLKKKAFIILADGQQAYSLPYDYLAMVPNTNWDIDNKWGNEGPMNDNIWNYRTYGYITTENKKMWRVWGAGDNPFDLGYGQFFIGPTPGGDPTTAGQPLTFEYITKNTFKPQNWRASTAYTAATSYVSASGQIYLANNSSTSGTTPPNAFYAIANKAGMSYGMDGGVMWRFIPDTAWTISTPYSLYDFVTNGGNWYRCTGPITSATTAPTGTDPDVEETDGTGTWQYVDANAWAAETVYAANDYVFVSTRLYIAVPQYVQGSVTTRSGKVAPTWNASTVSDGTQVWDMVALPYETIRADTDQCMFDDDVVIAGLTWRYLRAKGAQYEDVLNEYNAKVDEALNRWNSSYRMSLADNTTALAGLRPNVPEGNFGF